MAPPPRAYKTVAGVAICPGGWLVLPARLAGITMVAEEAFVCRRLAEVLDYRPRFEFAGIEAPMGFRDEPDSRFRECDDEARRHLAWPRMVGVRPVPSRAALRAPSRQQALELEPWLTKDDLRRFRWYREAEQEIQPFHQRIYSPGNADLSFQQMNGDVPLTTSPFHEDGRIERLELIRMRMPGVEEVVSRVPPEGAGPTHMLNAAAMLFTGRRASARGVSRLPADPEWDSAGLRMELVR